MFNLNRSKTIATVLFPLSFFLGEIVEMVSAPISTNKKEIIFWSEFFISSLHADGIPNVDAELMEGIGRGKILCMQNTKVF